MIGRNVSWLGLVILLKKGVSMSNVSDTERRDIADYLHKMGNKGFDFNGENVARAINANPAFDAKCWMRLANLIEPSDKFSLSDICDWASKNMEGCDGLEFSMYNSIYVAIQKYLNEKTDKE